MIKIILEYFSNDRDDALNFLGIGLWTFTKSEQLYHGLREDDFADFEVNLIVFEDFDLVNAPLDPNVLKDGDNKVDDLVLFFLSHCRTNIGIVYQIMNKVYFLE